tara:strand:- start:278 stop:418 length:141 start_codon:yes stop_codon:yes gene_type:complete
MVNIVRRLLFGANPTVEEDKKMAKQLDRLKKKNKKLKTRIASLEEE